MAPGDSPGVFLYPKKEAFFFEMDRKHGTMDEKEIKSGKDDKEWM
jgi:hypothetical protein